MKILRFDTLPSTNRYCENLDPNTTDDFTCIWALSQSSGIGQQGNSWISAPEQNLTFSLFLKPQSLLAAQQFRLTQAISLALVDYLQSLHIGPTSIKWPNDIYIAGKKICGTLISTHLTETKIATAICGIGLNVNQTQFPPSLPNPTSMALLTDTTFQLEPQLLLLLKYIEKRYIELQQGHDPTPEYLSHLLLLGQTRLFRIKDSIVEATLTGIDPYGRLLLTTPNNHEIACAMKEVAFLETT